MQTADFDYDLPQELIAQTPIEPRDAARLLVLDRQAGLRHQQVRNLPQLLDPGDLLVVNRSRVLPGRIHGRLRGGGRAELLLLRRLGPGRWQALGRPARRLRPDATVSITPGLAVRIVGLGEAGLREVCVESNDDQATDPDAALLAAGSLPLPPYIHTPIRDPERYQTIFADVDGSAAAPTAGLHFTPALLDRLRERGVGLTSIVLHVGLDTFRPVDTADPRGHPMHREWYTLDDETSASIAATRQAGRRVVAVGTTCVRALETWASRGGASQGWTDLFILPGYRFQVVDALLTNFHLPRSTLLMLVSAFAGRERVLAAYAEAIRRGYRFYSFGDAMLVL
jgi:S-adenosylmethionine:tRNA ribosyltransferase-isomerase